MGINLGFTVTTERQQTNPRKGILKRGANLCKPRVLLNLKICIFVSTTTVLSHVTRSHQLFSCLIEA